LWPARRTRSRRSSHVAHDTAPIPGIAIPGARGKDLRPRSRVGVGVVHLFFFPGSRVTTDQRVVAKQEIQEAESAKRAGVPYSHHRNQAKDTNTILGEHLPKPTRREKAALRRGRKLEVAQGTVYISKPERSWIRPWRWCCRRQQRSYWGGIYVHPEEGILLTLRARTRSLPSTWRPVTSDRPPPRRCGQAAWAAASRPIPALTQV
jgi:hypothetical protein